jgi:hypothetical protein
MVKPPNLCLRVTKPGARDRGASAWPHGRPPYDRARAFWGLRPNLFKSGFLLNVLGFYMILSLLLMDFDHFWEILGIFGAQFFGGHRRRCVEWCRHRLGSSRPRAAVLTTDLSPPAPRGSPRTPTQSGSTPSGRVEAVARLVAAPSPHGAVQKRGEGATLGLPGRSPIPVLL